MCTDNYYQADVDTMGWSSLGNIENGPRTNFGCVNIDCQKVLMIGGKMFLEGMKNCDVWDMQSKKWSAGPSLPLTMKYCRATLLDGYVYVIGTYTEFYRLKIDQMELGWQRLPAAKTDGLGCELVSDDMYIYRIGDTCKRTSMHRYDPRRHIWQLLPEMEVGRDFHSASVVNGKIYVIGGRRGVDEEKALSSVSVYHISKKRWRPGPELPLALYKHAAIGIKNFILVTGGQQKFGSRALMSCYILNIETQNWSQLNTFLPQGFSSHSLVANGWTVTLFGGTSGFNDDKDKPIFSSDIYPLLFQKRRGQRQYLDYDIENNMIKSTSTRRRQKSAMVSNNATSSVRRRKPSIDNTTTSCDSKERQSLTIKPDIYSTSSYPSRVRSDWSSTTFSSTTTLNGKNPKPEKRTRVLSRIKKIFS